MEERRIYKSSNLAGRTSSRPATTTADNTNSKRFHDQTNDTRNSLTEHKATSKNNNTHITRRLAIRAEALNTTTIKCFDNSTNQTRDSETWRVQETFKSR